MIKKIRHVGIDVKDIELSLKFYAHLLGFEEKERLLSRHGKILQFLRKGSATLELIKHPENRDIDCPISHLAIEVEDMDKAVAVIERCSGEYGLELLQKHPFEFNGDKIYFFCGPDGEKIEMMQGIKSRSQTK